MGYKEPANAVTDWPVSAADRAFVATDMLPGCAELDRPATATRSDGDRVPMPLEASRPSTWNDRPGTIVPADDVAEAPARAFDMVGTRTPELAVAVDPVAATDVPPLTTVPGEAVTLDPLTPTCGAATIVPALAVADAPESVAAPV